MRPKTRKRVTYATIMFYFFFSGVEYAVILPTAWLYLHERFHAEPYMLGMLLSAFCLSSMIAGPIMGRWSDDIKRTKVVILFANLWQVAGSLLYWFGYGPWCLVGGRFVAGIGTGMGPVILADIARVTSIEERTATLTTFSAVRQLGLLLGPACNLFLRKLNFKIGPYVVDKFTSPGLFMALLWTVFELVILVLYSELPEIQIQIQGDFLKAQVDDTYHRRSDNTMQDTLSPSSSGVERLPTADSFSSTTAQGPEELPDASPGDQASSSRLRSPPINTALRHNHLDVMLTSSNEMIESAEKFMLTPEPHEESPDGLFFDSTHFAAVSAADFIQGRDGEEDMQLGDENQSRIFENPAANRDPREFSSASSTALWTCKFYYDEYMREEIVVLLAAVFMSLFVQLSLETLLTPLANSLMDWDEVQISYLYIGCSVEVLIIFAILQPVSRRVADRTLILFGYLCEVATLVYLMWFLPSAPPHDANHNLPFLLVSLFFNILGLPFLFVCSNSLFTKLTRKETQGFSQGIRRFSGGLGNLLGPLWTGGLLNNLTVLLAVLLAMISLATLMVIISFTKLKPKTPTPRTRHRSGGSDSTSSERTPLLS